MQFIEKVFIFYWVLLQIWVMFRSFEFGNWEVLFYVCNHIILFLVILYVWGRVSWVRALINVGFLFQVGWTLDFLFRLIFGFYLFGVTSYVFDGVDIFANIISVLVHVSTLIPAFFLVRKYDVKVSVLYFSMVYLTVLYVLTLLFTNPLNDINCVFSACNISFLQFNYFTILYLPIAFVLVLVPTYYLQKYMVVRK